MAALLSCKDNQTTSRVMVTLTDSPGDYQQVNVQIEGVQVQTDSPADSGWVDLNLESSAKYNLLDLTNGVSVLLGEADIPAGHISQIRLILGTENSVMVDSVVYDLTTPSAQQSGLKLQVNQDLVEGITYNFKLDFDAAKSVVKAGSSGKYNLKPVIRVITEATSGAVKGVVNPAEENVAVYAMSGTDTVATTYAVKDISQYLLGGVEAGTYNIVFDPGDSSDYQSTTINDINVVTGEVYEMDTVNLVLK